MDEIVFLGTGGGRFTMITQWRATGGIRLNLGNTKIHVDPGPGALVHCKGQHQNPQGIRYLIVTHAHPDHSTDMNVLIEAMTSGTTKLRGTLVASKSVMEGVADLGPCASLYHLNGLKEHHTAIAGQELMLGDVKLRTIQARHSDPTTFGARFEYKDKVIVYTSDTEYFEELSQEYEGADIFIVNQMRPGADRIPHHLCTVDTIKLVKKAKPKLVVLSHFGMKMLRAGPVGEAQRIQKETGIRTIAAEDGMHVSLDETDQSTLGSFD